jgi:hypothetical protein
MIALCETDLERIKIQLLHLRQLIAAGRLPESTALSWSILVQYGYDPDNPKACIVRTLHTTAEVSELVVPENVPADDPLDEDIPSVIISMLGELNMNKTDFSPCWSNYFRVGSRTACLNLCPRHVSRH